MRAHSTFRAVEVYAVNLKRLYVPLFILTVLATLTSKSTQNQKVIIYQKLENVAPVLKRAPIFTHSSDSSK